MKNNRSLPARRAVLQGGLALASAAMANGASAQSPRPSPVVETAGGKVRGFQDGGAQHFLGIPYGAPTGGKNRFMPPVKAPPWTGIREAGDFGAVSPQSLPGAPAQRSGALANMHAAPKAGETEDCLNLNVWTPAADGARRPVMVWIHGGGYSTGSGSMAVYNGANLAVRGDVVVVGVTHRLNVLGYTYLGELLGEDFAHSGIVGILDLVMALEWVRDNIERFGGDPRQVTIFGESGGGGKVSTLLAMPGAKGLFGRAVIQSGAGIFLPERPEAAKVARTLLEQYSLQPNQAGQLRTMPILQLLEGGLKLQAKMAGGPAAFSPVVDGSVLPGQPCYPLAPEFSRDVPLLVGSNLTESAYRYMYDPSVFGMDEAKLRARFAAMMGTGEVNDLLALYRRDFPQASPTDLWMLINTERSMRRNTWRMADARAASASAPTFVYHFRFETPYMQGQLKSPHFLEVPLVFHNHRLPGVVEFTGGGERADRMADTLSEAWVAFARTGKPAAKALPAWTPYGLAARDIMVLNETSRLEHDPDSERRRYWQSHDYQIL